MNKITAVGRIVAEAEVRFTSGGDLVASFRLASDVGYGDKKTTNWFSCQVWGKRAESIAQYLAKGSQVTVFGSLTMREWTNKEGVKQLSPDIRVDEIVLPPKSESVPTQKPANSAKQKSAEPFADMSDDIPF